MSSYGHDDADAVAWDADEMAEGMRSAALDVALGHDDEASALHGLEVAGARALTRVERAAWPLALTEARRQARMMRGAARADGVAP